MIKWFYLPPELSGAKLKSILGKMSMQYSLKYIGCVLGVMLFSSCDPLVNQFADVEDAVMYRAGNIKNVDGKKTIKVMTWNIRFGVARLDFFGDG